MSNPAPADYPIHQLLQQRWSPRAFSDKAIEPAILLRLFEAARWAPSSYNEQPWAFFVATKDQPDNFAKLLSCLIEFNQNWTRSASVLVLTATHLTLVRNGQPNRHAYHDLGLAVAQLTVQASHEGLFVHQMAGIVPETARQVLTLPSGWDPVTALAIGHVADPSTLSEELRKRELAPRQRKPLSAFTFGATWGQPWETLQRS